MLHTSMKSKYIQHKINIINWVPNKLQRGRPEMISSTNNYYKLLQNTNFRRDCPCSRKKSRIRNILGKSEKHHYTPSQND